MAAGLGKRRIRSTKQWTAAPGLAVYRTFTLASAIIASMAPTSQKRTTTWLFAPVFSSGNGGAGVTSGRCAGLRHTFYGCI